MPWIRQSKLPGVLGLKALTNSRTILDCVARKLYFLGPGDYDLMSVMPAGTRAFDLERAPSGHLLLPITHYEGFDQQQRDGTFQLDPIQSTSEEPPVTTFEDATTVLDYVAEDCYSYSYEDSQSAASSSQ